MTNKLAEQCFGVTKAILTHGSTFTPIAKTAKMKLETASMTDKETVVNGLPVPVFQIHTLPLPKLDTPNKIEEAVLGLSDPLKFDEGEVYGIFNFPHRAKMRVGKNKDQFKHNIERMIAMAWANMFYGPYLILHPYEWGGKIITPSEQEALKCCNNIMGYVLGHPHVPLAVANTKIKNKLAVVQLTPDVIRLVVCEDRIVPQLCSDMYGACGIVVGDCSK